MQYQFKSKQQSKKNINFLLPFSLISSSVIQFNNEIFRTLKTISLISWSINDSSHFELELSLMIAMIDKCIFLKEDHLVQNNLIELSKGKGRKRKKFLCDEFNWSTKHWFLKNWIIKIRPNYEIERYSLSFPPHLRRIQSTWLPIIDQTHSKFQLDI